MTDMQNVIDGMVKNSPYDSLRLEKAISDLLGRDVRVIYCYEYGDGETVTITDLNWHIIREVVI